jgi:hypothetical protein
MEKMFHFEIVLGNSAALTLIQPSFESLGEKIVIKESIFLERGKSALHLLNVKMLFGKSYRLQKSLHQLLYRIHFQTAKHNEKNSDTLFSI